MIETIEDGKLVNVRVINTYRETAIDIKIKIEEATDIDAEECAVSTEAQEVAPAAEIYNAEFAELRNMTLDVLTHEYIKACVNEDKRRLSIINDVYESIRRADEEYCDELREEAKADLLKNKIRREVKACDDNDDVFNLLPSVDELNDVDEEAIIVKEEIVNMYGKTFSFININGERVSFIDGEVHIISSDKYDAHFNRKTRKYVVAIIEEGNFKPITFDTDEEFFAEMAKRGACTIDTPEPPTVNPDEYAITQEAFDYAVKAEEYHNWQREYDEYDARRTARILSNPDIDAAYQKAKLQVKVDVSGNYPLFYFRKKNSTEWEYSPSVAKVHISKCGLSHTEFIVKAGAEPPTVEEIFAVDTAEKDLSTLKYFDNVRKYRSKGSKRVELCQRGRNERWWTISPKELTLRLDEYGLTIADLKPYVENRGCVID